MLDDLLLMPTLRYDVFSLTTQHALLQSTVKLRQLVRFSLGNLSVPWWPFPAAVFLIDLAASPWCMFLAELSATLVFIDVPAVEIIYSDWQLCSTFSFWQSCIANFKTLHVNYRRACCCYSLKRLLLMRLERDTGSPNLNDFLSDKRDKMLRYCVVQPSTKLIA